MAAGDAKHIIIVGGGASGVLLACHLLRDAGEDFRVTLIEKRPALGRGMAYSTAQPGHLLNVRATNMSAFADDELHFCRWLAERGGETCDGQGRPPLFAQRHLYGEYIAELIAPYLGEGGRLDTIRGEGRTIASGPDGVRIGLDDGRTLSGDIAVLATGHDEMKRDGPACYVNPWESPSAAGVDRDAAVLIRGTGLTMVDYVVSLRANGHRGPIYAMSRRGLIPQPHRPVHALKLERKDVPFGASLVTLWRWLRRLAKTTMAEGGDWRSVVDGIRPYTWEIWQRLPFDSKQRFLRHARAWWEVHRHRMAPEVAAEIDDAVARGQLRIVAAKTASLTPRKSGAHVDNPIEAPIFGRRRGKSMQKPLLADQEIKRVDPIWDRVRREAEETSAREPVLASLLYATILSEPSFEDAVCHRLAQRLEHSVDAGLLHKTFHEVLAAEPGLGDIFRADLMAVAKRDPACRRLIDPLLYFKGFHALETFRFAHALWNAGRYDFALYLQSLSSRILQVDIHPAARIGRGVMLDHATGIVIGETAVIGDNCSLLHGVTLGGTGNERGDRHPKIGSGVMMGSGAKILGNIRIGDCVRIAAGSVVLQDVPPRRTVAGVPAHDIGPAGCEEPALVMDQLVEQPAC